MTCKQIVFTEKNKAELLNEEVKTPSDDEVVVKTAVSTISCGTERANITGDPTITIAAVTPPVSFPRMLGYSSAGVVTQVGKNITRVKVGDRVAVAWAYHKEYNTVPEKNVVKLDDGISFETAAMMLISTFPMAAIRKTRLEMGESAIVMGLGVLGMIGIKLLRAAGAVPIIAADPNEARREIALKNGADYALDPLCDGFAEKVKEITNGGVNVAIEVTGVGAGFNEALDCMAKFGRVALLGCTRNSDFTVDYYKKIHGPGITVIGAHTLARPACESRPGWFTDFDDLTASMKMCGGGRICLEDLVEETHSPEDCGEVYNRLVFDKNFPIVVQFDWRKLK